MTYLLRYYKTHSYIISGSKKKIKNYLESNGRNSYKINILRGKFTALNIYI